MASKSWLATELHDSTAAPPLVTALFFNPYINSPLFTHNLKIMYYQLAQTSYMEIGPKKGGHMHVIVRKS